MLLVFVVSSALGEKCRKAGERSESGFRFRGSLLFLLLVLLGVMGGWW